MQLMERFRSVVWLVAFVGAAMFRIGTPYPAARQAGRHREPCLQEEPGSQLWPVESRQSPPEEAGRLSALRSESHSSPSEPRTSLLSGAESIAQTDAANAGFTPRIESETYLVCLAYRLAGLEH